jgi:hypothetical protein
LLLPLLLLQLLLLLLLLLPDESEGGSELATELGIYKLPTLMFCGKHRLPPLLRSLVE